MRALVVATSTTPQGIAQEVASSSHHRIDYLSLTSVIGGSYIDYGAVDGGLKAIEWFEGKARFDLRLARRATKIAAKENHDVVVSLSERVGIPLAHSLHRATKHVVIMHHPMSPRKLQLLRALRTKNRWSKIITISTAEARGLETALDLPANSVQTVHTPIDPEFFDPAREEPVPLAAQDHVLSLGLSHRDYRTLIRAMRSLPDIPCQMRIGSTWVDHQADHGHDTLPDNIEVKGFVHPEILRQRYLRSRFIVVPIQPSTQWAAGCNTVQQAQAMGKAVVATDRPGLADYLVDGETGILVPPENDAALAEAIRYLWDNPDVAGEMGRKGRFFQVSNYSFDAWLCKMRRILDNVALVASA